MFRGIRQDDTKVIVQPSADLDIALQSADDGLKSTSLNFGTWNSLHTGDAGLKSADRDSDAPATSCGTSPTSTRRWRSVSAGGSLGITYTAYTSPNAGFNNVKEVMFKFGADDSGALGKAALHPWVIVAFEFDADNGHQADGGSKAG